MPSLKGNWSEYLLISVPARSRNGTLGPKRESARRVGISSERWVTRGVLKESMMEVSLAAEKAASLLRRETT